MNNLTQRILTGSLFVTALVLCIIWNEYSAAVIFLIFSTLATIEFYQILNKKELSNNTKYGPFVNVVVYSLLTLVFIEEIHDYKWLFLIVPFLLILVLQELFAKDNIPYQNISSTLFPFYT